MDTVLLYGFYFAVSLVEGLMAYLTCLWFGGKRFKLSSLMLLIVALQAYITFGPLVLPTFPLLATFNSIILPIAIFYILARGLHGKKSHPILVVFLMLVHITLFQGVSIGVLGLIFNKNIVIAPTTERTYYLLINHIAIIVMAYLLKNVYFTMVKKISQVLKTITSSVRSLLYLLTICIILIFVFGVAVIHQLSSSNQYPVLQLVIIAILSVGMATTLYVIHSVLKNHVLLSSYQSQSDMLHSYEKIQVDLKGFWHSYANIMQVIKILVTTEHLEVSDVKDALEEFLVAHDKEHVTQKLRIINIPHTVLACILSSKLDYADQLGVDLDIDITGAGAIDINMRDLTEVLGILLDNAIEVAHFADKRVSIVGDISPEQTKICIANELLKEAGHTKKYGKSNGIGKKRVESLFSRQPHLSLNVHETSTNYLVNLSIANRHAPLTE